MIMTTMPHRFRVLYIYTPAPRRGRGVYCFTSVLPSVQDIFCHIFLSNCWWQKSDIWKQASYRYTILWVAFLDPSDSYFLFAEELGYHKWALAHSSSCLGGGFSIILLFDSSYWFFFVDLDNRTVVCYCSVGYRSSMVVEKVQEYYKKTGKVSQYL